MDKRDFMRRILQKEAVAEEEALMGTGENDGDGEQNDSPLPETEGTFLHNQHTQVCQRHCFPQAGPAALACTLLCSCNTSRDICE